jgi:GTP cyclohydrolase IB
MNAVPSVGLSDVQASPDHRGVAIDEVGIADLRFPVVVAGRDGGVQNTVATVAMDVDLAAGERGTHMSRFLEVLTEAQAPVTAARLHELADAVRERMGASRARISIAFPYFLDRAAPVTGLSAPVDYEGRLVAHAGPRPAVDVSVRVPVTSLCPCSREISDYGAHNQRGHVEIDVACQPDGAPWLEDLIDVAEGACSAPIYALLKRSDERHVTMQAYENAAFVEDMARDVAVALRAHPTVRRYRVSVTNQESIHNHNAVATVRGATMREADA